MKGHTEEPTDSAKLARKLQNIIGRPSTNEFIRMIGQGKMQQFPIDRNIVYAAEDIFGPDVYIQRKNHKTKDRSCGELIQFDATIWHYKHT